MLSSLGLFLSLKFDVSSSFEAADIDDVVVVAASVTVVIVDVDLAEQLRVTLVSFLRDCSTISCAVEPKFR